MKDVYDLITQHLHKRRSGRPVVKLKDNLVDKIESDWDWVSASPFYEDKPKKKKRKQMPGSSGFVPESWRKARVEEAKAELAKPVEQRIGKLRSAKAGDFKKEEIKAFEKQYGMKFRPKKKTES